MIIPLYKPIGPSTHYFVKKYAEMHGVKATHTGSLDPMAEGVVIVLTDEDVHQKSVLSNWRKTYHFNILFGFRTDTHDLLGLIEEKVSNNVAGAEAEEKLAKIIPDYQGELIQVIPDFSAQRIDGQSYFDWAKKKKKLPRKTNTIEINSLEIINRKNITRVDISMYLKQNIAQVIGDFRQAQILQTWEATFSELKKRKIDSFPLIKLRAQVSKRTYIRALVRDFAEATKIPATTFSIRRVQNGKYQLADVVNI